MLCKHKPDYLPVWLIIGVSGILFMVFLGYRVRGKEVIRHHYLWTIVPLSSVTIVLLILIGENWKMENFMDNFIRYGIPLYIFFYIIFSLIFCYKQIKRKNFIKVITRFIPPALFTLLIAYVVYVKANDFVDRSVLFQFSDRCLAEDIKINDENGRIYPIFINQGGDALSYEELIRQYNSSRGELRNSVQKVLLKIYNNIETSDENFKEEYFEVCRSKGLWTFNTPANSVSCGGAGVETWAEFDVPNVISQVPSPDMLYWTTRARSAKLLQNLDYLKDKKNFHEANWQNLRDYEWATMFQNLTKNISSDPSLIVRKISLDTYKLWVCLDHKSDQEKLLCEERFVSDNIYHFESAIQDWQSNKIEILDNFKKNIGL